VLFGVVLLVYAGLVVLERSVLSDAPVESASIYQPASTPGDDLGMIEANAGLTTPPGAREIYAVISGFRELDAWVIFDLPAGELEALLGGTLCEYPPRVAEPTHLAPGELDPKWWLPNDSSDLLECHGAGDYLRQQVLVDRTDPEMFTVYVFAMTDRALPPAPSSE
jgi:hypothetical protein